MKTPHFQHNNHKRNPISAVVHDTDGNQTPLLRPSLKHVLRSARKSLFQVDGQNRTIQLGNLLPRVLQDPRFLLRFTLIGLLLHGRYLVSNLFKLIMGANSDVPNYSAKSSLLT